MSLPDSGNQIPQMPLLELNQVLVPQSISLMVVWNADLLNHKLKIELNIIKLFAIILKFKFQVMKYILVSNLNNSLMQVQELSFHIGIKIGLTLKNANLLNGKLLTLSGFLMDTKNVSKNIAVLDQKTD